MWCEKRGQAAVETMSVYGWVILIVAVAAGAFFVFYSANQSNFVVEECALGYGLACEDFRIDEGSITLNIKNNMDWDLKDVKFIYSGCGVDSGRKNLTTGEKKEFTVSGCNFVPESVFEDNNLTINYSFAGNDVVHMKSFSLVGAVEGGDSQSFGDDYNVDGSTIVLFKFDDGDGNLLYDKVSNANAYIYGNERAIALYNFDEGRGSNTTDKIRNINASLGNGLCPDPSCPDWHSSGLSGRSLEYDGIGNYVNISSNSVFDEAIDVRSGEFWFATYDGGGEVPRVIYEEGDGNIGLNVVILYDMVFVHAWDGSSDVSLNTGISLSEWHHVAYVFDSVGSEKLKMYYDGVEVTSSGVSVSSPILQHEANSGIGAMLDGTKLSIPWNGDGFYFNGLIDEVAFYDYALTDKEVNFSFHSRKAREYTGWVDGKTGSGLQFDGDTYVNAGGNTLLQGILATGVTWEAWVYLYDDTGGTIFSKNPDNYLKVNPTTRTVTASFKRSGTWGNAVITSTKTLNVGNWHHLAAEYNRTNGRPKLFFDGVSDLNPLGVPNTDIDLSGGNFLIGKDTTETNYFNGIIDEVRVSNYPRY